MSRAALVLLVFIASWLTPPVAVAQSALAHDTLCGALWYTGIPSWSVDLGCPPAPPTLAPDARPCRVREGPAVYDLTWDRGGRLTRIVYTNGGAVGSQVDLVRDGTDRLVSVVTSRTSYRYRPGTYAYGPSSVLYDDGSGVQSRTQWIYDGARIVGVDHFFGEEPAGERTTWLYDGGVMVGSTQPELGGTVRRTRLERDGRDRLAALVIENPGAAIIRYEYGYDDHDRFVTRSEPSPLLVEYDCHP